MKRKIIVSFVSAVMLLSNNIGSIQAQEDINYKFIELVPGQKKKLKIKEASSTVNWKSTSNKIVKISKDGAVKGLKAGSATVTGTVGASSYSCDVFVNKKPSILIEKTKMGVGHTEKLFLLYNNDQKVSWDTTNHSIMTVSSKGVIKAKKTGSVTIKAKSNGLTYKRKVKVVKEGQDTISIGTSIKLPKPEKKVKWSTSNKKVICVNKNGTIKVLNSGGCTIKAKGSKKSYTFKYKIPKLSISSKNRTIGIGESVDLNIHHYNGTVKWSSSNNGIATVTNHGLVKGITSGQVKITAKMESKKLVSTIFVNEKSNQGSLIHNSFSTLNKSTEDGIHMLVIGNSLSIHPVASNAWWGLWGMAASKAQYDYPHVLSSMIARNENVMTDVINFGGDWERAPENGRAMYPLLTPYLTGDIDMIVIQLGENYADNNAFKSNFNDLMCYLKQKEKNAKFYVLSQYFSNIQQDQIKKEICKKYQAQYIELKNIYSLPSCHNTMNGIVYGEDGKTHQINTLGVALHPSDIGMKKMAQSIYEYYLKNQYK